MLVATLETSRSVIRDARADAESIDECMKREQYWHDLPMDPPTLASIASMVNAGLLDQAKEPRSDYFMAAVDQAKPMRRVLPDACEIGWSCSQSRPDFPL